MAETAVASYHWKDLCYIRQEEMAETAVDLLSKNLKQLISNKVGLIHNEKDHIESLYKEVGFLRAFLKDLEKKCYQCQKVQDLVGQIKEFASRAEDTIDLSEVDAVLKASHAEEDTTHDLSQVDAVLKASYEEDTTGLSQVDVVLKDIATEEKSKCRNAVNLKLPQFVLVRNLHPLEIKKNNQPAKKKNCVFMGKQMSHIFSFCLNLDWKKKKKKNMEMPKKNTLHMFHCCLNAFKNMEDIDMPEKIGHALDPSVFGCITQEIEAIKREVMKIYENEEDIAMADNISHVCDPSIHIVNVNEEFEAIKTEVMEIYDKKSYEIGAIQYEQSPSGHLARQNIFMGGEEIAVGFDDETTIMKEHLAGSQKQLHIISIVGMPGLGKTTLARKVYNDPLIVYRFNIRAWINVSQEYQNRDLLLGILSSVIHLTEKNYKMSNEKLGEQLYKLLKGKRYLIVMDDMWNTGAWDYLKSYFPNDNNGSKIMFTSRLADVLLHAKTASTTHFLHLLTEDESWELLQRKVFLGETFPPELLEIGKQIAKKCRGLPLAIVVVAGILANKKKREDQWRQVEETLTSCIVAHSQICKETLALSYNHLPHHLKQCFLYFGAFREDYDIPMRKLIWLWIAEGFIPKIDQKSLEDVAEGFLMDLISRSLVLVSKRRSDGGIKACGIHDLLRDFCLKEAEKEDFLKQISEHQYLSSSPSSSKHFSRMRRMSIHPEILQDASLLPSALNTRSFLCVASGNTRLPLPQFLSRCFKILRVLDISSFEIYRYPSEIENLVLLRYLALGNFSGNQFRSLPASISNLRNLETFILSSSSSSVMLPHSVCDMVWLRHLSLRGPRSIVMERGCCSGSLDNLQTLSCIDPFYWSNSLAVTPNLRKLGLRGRIVSGGFLCFPDIHFLKHLQKLKLSNTNIVRSGSCSTKLLKRVKFPPDLKMLTLEKTYLKWDEVSTLGKLVPKLEVLKLLSGACSGECWETGDGEFPRLKFLKFHSAQLREWQVLSDHFPRLERLVFVECHGLQKIPSEIGDIPTLHVIEMHWCNPSIASSAKEIKDEQESMGNNWLQIIESNIGGSGTADSEDKIIRELEETNSEQDE